MAISRCLESAPWLSRLVFCLFAWLSEPATLYLLKNLFNKECILPLSIEIPLIAWWMYSEPASSSCLLSDLFRIVTASTAICFFFTSRDNMQISAGIITAIWNYIQQWQIFTVSPWILIKLLIKLFFYYLYVGAIWPLKLKCGENVRYNVSRDEWQSDHRRRYQIQWN